MCDIASMPNRHDRLNSLLRDCHSQQARLMVFADYFAEALSCPFAATWHDPADAQHIQAIQVLEVDTVDERWGISLRVQWGAAKWRFLAEQVWADDRQSVNATVLDDYRYWIEETGGSLGDFEG